MSSLYCAPDHPRGWHSNRLWTRLRVTPEPPQQTSSPRALFTVPRPTLVGDTVAPLGTWDPPPDPQPYPMGRASRP